MTYRPSGVDAPRQWNRQAPYGGRAGTCQPLSVALACLPLSVLVAVAGRVFRVLATVMREAGLSVIAFKGILWFIVRHSYKLQIRPLHTTKGPSTFKVLGPSSP